MARRSDTTTLARRIGEYPIVVRNTVDPDALVAANRTRIDERDAARLVRAAMARYGIPYELYFGRTRRNSWGGLRSVRGRRIGYLSFVPAGPQLTVGTVLHEVAHVVGMWTRVTHTHDERFTQILDLLIARARF